MKFFKNVTSILLVTAICCTTAIAAFPSENSTVSTAVTSIDSVQTAQNDHSLFLDEVSVAEFAPIFKENQLQYSSVYSLTANQAFRSINQTEAIQLFVFIEHKNKHLAAQLFPTHFFW